MKIRFIAASLIAITTAATAANALTIENKDAKEYKLSVQLADGSTTAVDVKAKGMAEANCKDGCTIIMGEMQHPVTDDTSKIVIKHGKIS